MNLKTTFTAWFVTTVVTISLSNSGGVTADPAMNGLLDPDSALFFVNEVPNALDPSFMFKGKEKKYKTKFKIKVSENDHWAGLLDADGERLMTKIWGYAPLKGDSTWPGKTFQVKKHEKVFVKWMNKLPVGPHLVTNLTNEVDVIDRSLHWAYGLPCCNKDSNPPYTVDDDGVPIVVHLHGGHTDAKYDGPPEVFFSRDFRKRGPRWKTKTYRYDNSQTAGTLWYHDHALGITRLNVYAGMAGFYIIRDNYDKGVWPNKYDLPVFPYEAALAIQDRFFKDDGQFFYPSFPNDPDYNDFIFGEGATLPEDIFPDGGPSILPEFFGDHMAVNGIIWPKMTVEPRNYRLRFLNGCDSRFLVVWFELQVGSPSELSFLVIGNDQGLIKPMNKTRMIIEPGGRYDIVIDFTALRRGSKVIMRNDGGDEPFSGQIPGNQIFNNTHQIMAFHVDTEFDVYVQNKAFSAKYHHPNNLVQIRDPNRIRDVGLFEGSDEFGRLQPLLGTAGPATDAEFNAINWPDDQSKCGSTCQMGSCEPGCGPGMFGNNGCPADCEGCPYFCAGLVGQMEGSIAWHSPTTENPVLGDVEEWDIWNLSADAHPIHLHLVHFEVISRHNIKYDTAIPLDPTDPDFDPLVDPPFTPAGDGIYLELQPIVQHTGAIGTGRKIVFPTAGNCDGPDGKCYSETSVTDYPPGFIDALVEGNRKDTVTALPGQVTKIRARFDKPGRYVWHCHILSHEDHEMMRVLYVGTGADARADHENV